MFNRKTITSLGLRPILLLIVVIGLIAGFPKVFNQPSNTIGGTIILWHTWSGANVSALENSIESFQTIYPDVSIIASYYESEQMFEKVVQSISLGFGPDIILAEQSLMQNLIDESVIAPIRIKSIESVPYLEKALASVLYEDAVYGLPVSLYTDVLFYNKALVDTPIESIQDLTSVFELGQTFGMGSSYADIIWGVAAFGGDLFDAEGKSILDDGALSQWLSWLQSQQELPQFYLNESKVLLRQLFVESSLSYFVDSSRQLPYLRNLLNDNLGVSHLPQGEEGKAQAILDSDILYVSQSASEQQQENAIAFGLFLGNREQQRRLVRDARIVPVNREVDIDKRFNPIIHTVNQQVENSFVNVADERFGILEELADTYFRQVIEGVVSAEMGAKALTDTLNSALGFEVSSSDMKPE